MQKKIYLILIVVFCLGACERYPELNNSIDPEAVILERYGEYGLMFNHFWNIIDTSYIYLGNCNINWESIKKQYLPKTKHITSEEQFGEMLLSIVEQLNDPLIQIYTSHNIYYLQQEADEAPTYYFEGGIKFEKYGILDSDQDGEYQINTLYDTSDPTRKYTLINISNGSGVSNNNFMYSYAQKRPTGFILDLRGSEYGLGDLESLMLFIAHFLPPTTFEFTLESKRDTQPIYLSGSNTVTQETPVVVIVNQESVGRRNIIAYVLSLLPNVTVIGHSATGGRGAINSLFPLRAAVNKYFDLIYPAYNLKHKELGSFFNPLQPDILIEGEKNKTIGHADPCIERAIDIINSKTNE